MPEKFFEYKKSKNYLRKNSCLKKIETNKYYNYAVENINYIHYSDYPYLSIKKCENRFTFNIRNHNLKREVNIKIKEEEKKERENEDNKDNSKQNQQINEGKEQKEEKETSNYLSHNNKCKAERNKYQKYNKDYKFKYFRRERYYINRKYYKYSKYSKYNYSDKYNNSYFY